MSQLIDPQTRQRIVGAPGRPPVGHSAIENVRESMPMYGGGIDTSAAAAGSSGKLLATLIPAEPGYTFSNILMIVGGTAFTLGSNLDSHWWLVACDLRGNVIGNTADQTTAAMGVGSVLNLGMVASATVPDGDFGFYAGIAYVLGTGGVPASGTWRGKANLVSGCWAGDGTIPGAPLMGIQSGAITTTLPASFSLTANGRSQFPYVRTW